jgi:hypothetical protein
MTGNKQKHIFLQPRDLKLLSEVAEMPFADREQIKLVAGFHSLTRVNTRLLSLTKAGLLRRVFIGTTGGGPKALYSLSRKGAQLIGVPYRDPRRAQDEILVTDVFVEHQVCLNSIQIVLRHRRIPVPGARLLRWQTFKEPLSEKARITPDAYFEIESRQGVHPMFLEVDLGTETMDRWKEKVGAYLRLALSGDFDRLFKQPRFRVLVVTRSERRSEFIRLTVSKTTDKIFWFSTFEAINRDGFWSAIWLRPKGDQKQALL